ncbi:MAG: response regulator [Actinomycetota bacterium]
MIRVLLADDHGVVRAGLQQLLANFEGIEVVGAASDGEQAVALASQTQPDVILMDLHMPEVDGIQATRLILEGRPGTSIVILTSFSEKGKILQALDAGAVGYLLKDAEPDELLRGIQAAARGESPLAPKAARAVLSARSEMRPGAELTEREREMLVLLAEGLGNKQMARRLRISEKTVKAHLTNAFRRIGVSDRTQAALWAERQGLLSSAEG